MAQADDINRLVEYYKWREKNIKLWTLLNPYSLFLNQNYERILLRKLNKYISNFMDTKILDVGCGTGLLLANYIRYGASLKNLYGIDLLDQRIAQAKESYPNINFLIGDASKLPYDDNVFDLVIQNTVFSSILDDKKRHDIASEMIRTTKENGIIVWYDAKTSRLNTNNFKAITKKEIIRYFPNCEYHFYKSNLHPKILALSLKLSWSLSCLLNSLIPWKTHYLGILVVRKNKLLQK